MTETIVLVLVGVVVVVGAVLGVGVVLRQGAVRPADLEADPTRARVAVEVHAGEEQVLIHLARTLGLPTGRTELGYGELYLAGSAGSTMKLGSRSEIGRGFDAEIRVQRTRRSSVVEYVILRLPGDERVLQRISSLDERIAASLLDLDPAAVVRGPGNRSANLRGFQPSAR